MCPWVQGPGAGGTMEGGGGPTAALPGKGPGTVPANPAKTHSSPKQDPAPAALNWQDTEGRRGTAAVHPAFEPLPFMDPTYGARAISRDPALVQD